MLILFLPFSPGQVPESKKARKRKKRRELANRAADAELAEISLEQQMLRELGHKSTSRSVRPRSTSREGKSPSRGLITDQNVVKQSKATKVKAHEPITLSIADMLDAFEVKASMHSLGLVLISNLTIGFKHSFFPVFCAR